MYLQLHIQYYTYTTSFGQTLHLGVFFSICESRWAAAPKAMSAQTSGSVALAQYVDVIKMTKVLDLYHQVLALLA